MQLALGKIGTIILQEFVKLSHFEVFPRIFWGGIDFSKVVGLRVDLAEAQAQGFFLYSCDYSTFIGTWSSMKTWTKVKE